MAERNGALDSAADEPRDAARVERTRRLSSPSLTHSMLYSVGSSGGTLVLQLMTGVLTARLLGSAGRGEIEAVMSWVNLSAIVFALGFGPGLAYRQAREPRPSASLLSAAAWSVLLFGSLAVVATELLIPLGFAEQRDGVVELARFAMFGIFAVMGTQMIRTLLASNNFFRPMSLNTVGQPLLYALGALALWSLGRYSVNLVVAIQIASFTAVCSLGAIVLWRVSGSARPDLAEVRSAFSFGIRGYPASLSRLANARLDVVLLPAFVAASDIGLYVVAVSVGSMMIALFQQLNRVMFTSVSRASDNERVELVERLVRVVGLGASSMAVFLMVLGPLLITVMYGDEFAGSGTPLRILLPGLVLWACSNVMGGALSGLGWPGRTSIAQISGLLVTVVGLAATLGALGINGAAIVSTVAYASVAFVTAWYLRRYVHISFRRIVSPSLAAHDVAILRDRALGRLRRSRVH